MGSIGSWTGPCNPLEKVPKGPINRTFSILEFLQYRGKGPKRSQKGPIIGPFSILQFLQYRGKGPKRSYFYGWTYS